MRSILFLMLTALVTAPAIPSALAAPPTKEEVNLMKDTVDYHKDRYKAVEKLADQLAKELEKEKETTETLQSLKTYYKEELERLREKGIPTVDDEPLPVHPQHADEYEPIPEDERAKLIALRDLVVELKGMDPAERPKPYQAKLAEFVTTLKDRYDRKQKSLDEETAK